MSFLLTKQHSSVVDVPKNVNGNIDWTKIKATKAQRSTKFVPKKFKITGAPKVTGHNQSICQCNPWEYGMCSEATVYNLTSQVPIIGNEQAKEEIITGNGMTTSDLISKSEFQPHSM